MVLGLVSLDIRSLEKSSSKMVPELFCLGFIYDKVFVSDHCDYIYDIDAQIVTRNKTVLINEK